MARHRVCPVRALVTRVVELEAVMGNSCFVAILIVLGLVCAPPVSSSTIDDSGPNALIVGKAFGFMLFGNDGFMKAGIENLKVEGCQVSFESSGGFYSHAIQRIYVNYDLNKANWKSAVYQMDYANNSIRFEVYGDKGLKAVNYDHAFDSEDELRMGVALLGLGVGPQNGFTVQLPNYMTKERYDRALWDLTQQCPGSPSPY